MSFFKKRNSNKDNSAHSGFSASSSKTHNSNGEIEIMRFGDVSYYAEDCFTGFCVFGGTGSGKTSGSGSAIASKLLDHGFGGLVLTFKPDEASNWIELIKEEGRVDDLMHIKINADSKYKFDFLHYEQTRKGGGSTLNIIDLLNIVIDLLKSNSMGASMSNKSGDDFWELSATQLLSSSIDLIKGAGQLVSIEKLIDFINTAPESAYMVASGNDNLLKFQLEEPDSYFTEIFNKVTYNFGTQQIPSEVNIRDCIISGDYFVKEYAIMPDKTRGSIKAIVLNTLYYLIKGEIGQIFASGISKHEDYNFNPEKIYEEGKIVILDIPVSEYGKLGAVVQSLYKYLFQKALDRKSHDSYKHKPVFLWADEAQYFINKYDPIFLTTARSTKCSTIFLTQNIQNYYNKIGEHSTNALLGNFQTKIFHQNTELSTNKYASDLAGKYWGVKGSLQQNSKDNHSSFGHSQELLNYLEPEILAKLPMGGIKNNCEVGAIIFKGGADFPNTINHKSEQERLPFTVMSFIQ